MHRRAASVLILLLAGSCKQRPPAPQVTPEPIPAAAAPEAPAQPAAVVAPVERPARNTTDPPGKVSDPLPHSAQEHKRLAWLSHCNSAVSQKRGLATSEDDVRVLDGLLTNYEAIQKACQQRGAQSQWCFDSLVEWMERVTEASPRIGAIPDDNSVLASSCGG